MSTLTTTEPQALALTTAEQQALATHEQTITHGIDTFVEVGNALAAIRADRLYRAQYATFEDYARERWEIGRQRAYQLMGAAAAVAAVSTIVDIAPPANEAQARPLAGLPPAQQREVWQEAVTSAPGGKPTAAHVQQVADKAKGKPAAPARPTLTPLPATPAAAPAGDDEIAAPAPARPAPPPLVMTPLTPAAPAPDRKLLATKRALLAGALALVEAELAASDGPTIVIHDAQIAQAARMFLSSPALNAAAAMLAFSAREEAA